MVSTSINGTIRFHHGLGLGVDVDELEQYLLLLVHACLMQMLTSAHIW